MQDKIKNALKEAKWEILILITGITLIYSTYAWFSSALDVNISDFKMTTNSEAGLTISLDGVDWGNSVEISESSITSELNKTYPGNTNQWSKELGPVSTLGIKTKNSPNFSMYADQNTILKKKQDKNRVFMSPIEILELNQNHESEFLAFDIFLKNVSGSPKSDNLYLDEGTSFQLTAEKDNTVINAMRMGMVFMDSINKRSSAKAAQNIKCNNQCSQMIYEPYSTMHHQQAIKSAKEHDIDLVDGQQYPTYAVKTGANKINIWSGIYGSSDGMDNNIFALQQTIKDFSKPIAKLPDGIMKIRVYIWIEGQDIDIAELISDGYKLTCSINFRKDMAGYE